MKKILMKVITLALIIFVYDLFVQTVSPIIANNLAMSQMQNTVDSSFWIQVYTYVSNYGWVVFVVLAVMMFYKDILEIIKKQKERKNEEN